MNDEFKIAIRLLAFLALTLSTAAHSDDFDPLKSTTPAQRASAQTEYMKSHFALTDEQLTKIGALNEKYAQQMEPVIKGTGGTLAKMLKAQAIQENKDADLRQILTPAQFDSFASSKDEMREAVKRKLLHD